VDGESNNKSDNFFLLNEFQKKHGIGLSVSGRFMNQERARNQSFGITNRYTNPAATVVNTGKST
jgi:hypothetical protein